MENTTEVKKDWTELKNKLKAKFPELTEADLHDGKSKQGEVLDKLRIKLGKTKEEWETITAGL